MNRYDLICKVAKSNNIPISAAKKYVDMTLAAMSDMIATKEPLSIARFGRFEVKTYSHEINAINPKTLKRLKVVRSPKISFYASEVLKDRIDENIH